MIEAVQFNGLVNGCIEREVMEFFIGNNAAIFVEEENLVIRNSRCKMKIPKGNWIIKGVEGAEGAFLSCNPEIFEATYEPV